MGNSADEAKRDSSDQCLWVGTPVLESTFFVPTGNNRTIHREETFIGYNKYDVAKSNKKGDIESY